jgi:invasion protein IalB
MSLKRILAGIAVAALMSPALVAVAQETPAPAEAPAATTDTPATTEAPAAEPGAGTADVATADPSRRPEDNWLKVCDPLENGQKACIMRQIVVANGQFLGSFLLRDDPGQESRLLAVAAVPLGVLLPFGLTWQIDGGKPIRVPFMLCDPQSCATQLVINEAYVSSLKRGGTLRLTAKNRQNEDLVIDINLAGFTAVYDNDSALTFDQFTQEATGPSALEQMLQDRAEQLRQELTGEEPPADGTTPAPADGTTPPAEPAPVAPAP